MDKRERNYNKTALIAIPLAILLIGLAAWGINQSNMRKEYKTALNNGYQRLFYDTKDHIENVEVSLSKALLSESKEQNIVLLSQIMQQSAAAQEKLSQMPIRHSDMSKTTRFLTQVSDYCNSLIKDHLEGKELTEEQRNSLNELSKYSTFLSSELSGLHRKIMKGDLNFDEIRNREDKQMRKANKDMLNTQLVKLEEEMTKYPELIYDGPFSDQARKIKPKALGDKNVTLEEAKKIVKDFLGAKKVRKITQFEAGKNLDSEATIPSYTFSVTPENADKEKAIYISVSKKGGSVVWMANPRTVGKHKLTMGEAQEKARLFLEEKGFKNMEPNYSLRNDGIAVFNYAYTENNVTVYPDLVKVKVALDNGEIVGIDSTLYLQQHHQRQISEPQISEEEARSRVKQDYNITSTRLAIIPKGINQEVLCYEFRGKYKNEDFIVYINALTGKEEQILRLIIDENGTLTF
ncbi:sporulation protein YpeB [Gottschalkia purinilytica]|uniref:Sporulation protein YpeB n=1 Tax=Gottschalkia purinilytica TaxID=1503 RepID=A0A0L0WEC3_GOTPU|nr:germination protein YpeB [Gottschalkia purinilytica]KNF09775.1 sporulation protein YpeB [Gottschalkia purinilytica]